MPVAEQIQMVCGRVPPGCDAVAGLRAVAKRHGFAAGAVSAVGALRNAVIGAYDFAAQRYVTKTLPGDREIVSLIGNLSLRDGVVFPHVHVVLGDMDCTLAGGHLFSGEVIMCEYTITGAVGVTLIRGRDAATGLYVYPHDDERSTG